MNPDLLFRRGTEIVFVADVMYKLTGSGLARTSDYYQLLAYTTALRLPRGMLIYCRADPAPDRVIRVVGGIQRLHTYPVDLGGSPESTAKALDEVAESIRCVVLTAVHPTLDWLQEETIFPLSPDRSYRR
ncbi:5-methylcytosine restriction system specificity protein McrC [Plantactinospora sp. CA-290183]|uniref:5-methylcytosine restriction system specificity protein McrC n=1 Tax=Plantactinospora sp. CA-290183 TaxID=3240006 RepID=UPI003D910CAA